MQYHLIFAIIVAIASFAAFVNDRYLKLPKIVALTTMSILIAILINYLMLLDIPFIANLKNILSNINFKVTVLDIMLGYLLFAGSLTVNSLELKKYSSSIIYLAFIGVIISTVIIGMSMYYISNLLKLKFSFYNCLMFGALVSPTDPIGVISIFQSMRVKLTATKVKIIGEALFNDAAVILLLVILTGFNPNYPTPNMTILQLTVHVLEEVFGGVLCGLFLGYITAIILSKTHDDEVILLITITLASAGYMLATIINVSAPLTMIISGLFLGYSSQIERFHIKTGALIHSFWEIIDKFLNTLLFILIGVEILTIKVTGLLIMLSIVMFVIIILTRVIILIIPKFYNWKFLVKGKVLSVNWKESAVLCWGGVRGAISIALALDIYHFPTKLITITYITVVLSIIIQGTTVKHLVRRLFPNKFL